MNFIVRAMVGAAAMAGVLIAGPGGSFAAGAFAVGACGAFGYSYDFLSMDDARARARSNCKGKRCLLVATMRKRCAALAIDATKPCGPYGWAVAARLGRAQNTALRQCYRHGGKTCVIRGWVCDAKG